MKVYGEWVTPSLSIPKILDTIWSIFVLPRLKFTDEPNNSVKIVKKYIKGIVA